MSTAISVLGVVAATFLGAGPTCPAGQKVSPETSGNCCWPKQVWSKSQARCVGLPVCPSGMVAAGEACEAAADAPAGPMVAPPPPPVWPDPVAPPPSAVERPLEPRAAPAQGKSTYEDGLLVPPGHHVERRPRGSLWGTGIGLFAGGWVLAIAADLGSLVFASSDTCTAWVGYTAWIPLAGPAVAAAGQVGRYDSRGGYGGACTSRPYNAVGTALAVLDTILQAGGVTMFILGLTIKESVVERDGVSSRDTEPPTLSLGIGVPGTATGISARLTW